MGIVSSNRHEPPTTSTAPGLEKSDFTQAWNRMSDLEFMFIYIFTIDHHCQRGKLVLLFGARATHTNAKREDTWSIGFQGTVKVPYSGATSTDPWAAHRKCTKNCTKLPEYQTISPKSIKISPKSNFFKIVSGCTWKLYSASPLQVGSHSQGTSDLVSSMTVTFSAFSLGLSSMRSIRGTSATAAGSSAAQQQNMIALEKWAILIIKIQPLNNAEQLIWSTVDIVGHRATFLGTEMSTKSQVIPCRGQHLSQRFRAGLGLG